MSNEKVADITLEDVEASFTRAFEVTGLFVSQHSDDGSYVDAAGVLRKAANTAAIEKRALLSEIPPDFGTVKGDTYQVVQPTVRTRSYSTTEIFSTLLRMFPDKSLLELIQDLIASKVIKLTWSWTNLVTYFNRHNVALITTGHEISDDEADVHVGVVESTGSAQFSEATKE